MHRHLRIVRKNQTKPEGVEASLITKKPLKKRVFRLWVTRDEPVDCIVLSGTLACGLYRAFRNAYFVLSGTENCYSPMNI